MRPQNSLPGIKVSGHSNLGGDFEKSLESTHDWYRLQKWADVRKVPHNWALISENEYRKLQGKLPGSMLARTDDGKFMQRMKSDVDFIGGGSFDGSRIGGSVMGGKRFSIAFDAKQTKGDKFPFANLEAHQLEKLRMRDRCGFVAGLMINFSDKDRIFFVSAAFLQTRYDQMLAQKRGRTAKRGTASISFADIEELTIEVHRHKNNMLIDWLPVISVFL